MDPIATVYWMVITLVYLAVSLLSTQWGRTWIIWPRAGIVYGIIVVIVKSILGKNKSE